MVIESKMKLVHVIPNFTAFGSRESAMVPKIVVTPGRTCFGTGLIALDLVTNGEENGAVHAWAGGSCGNVLTILSYLGWAVFPVARLGDDAASKAVASDMAQFGVNHQYVSFDKSIHTPIIVERIFVSEDGLPTHRFHWTCPNCGNWLPRYCPIRLKDIHILRQGRPKMTCFYFDRVSPASLWLAEMARQEGGFVVFEPTGMKDNPQFRKAIDICDVLKYSNERARNSPQIAYESQTKLVVETMGAEGLRYRIRRNGKCGEWKLMSAFRVRNLKDTAGAGDWCTAGMIHKLSCNRNSLDRISEKKIVDSLRYGQALSALNCGFEGARGTMYGIQKSYFDNEIDSILAREEASGPVVECFPDRMKRATQCVCPLCQSAKKRAMKK